MNILRTGLVVIQIIFIASLSILGGQYLREQNQIHVDPRSATINYNFSEIIDRVPKKAYVIPAINGGEGIVELSVTVDFPKVIYQCGGFGFIVNFTAFVNLRGGLTPREFALNISIENNHRGERILYDLLLAKGALMKNYNDYKHFDPVRQQFIIKGTIFWDVSEHWSGMVTTLNITADYGISFEDVPANIAITLTF